MSHIAKKPIQLPENVSIDVQLPFITVKGPLGESFVELPSGFNGSIQDDGQFAIFPLQTDQIPAKNRKKQGRWMKKQYALWGTYRTLVYNMVIGVSRGFSVKLELIGVGYRAQIVSDDILRLKLGLSHLVDYAIPTDVKITCLRPNLICISGINRQRVHQIASEIRRYRKPEPYKGKGIRYEGELITLKEGKKK